MKVVLALAMGAAALAPHQPPVAGQVAAVPFVASIPSK